MSESIINPYRFAVSCVTTCFEENNGGDHGMDSTDMACGQRIDAGSSAIGCTISSCSWWLKSGSGSTGTLYGVLFDTDYQTVKATFGSINANTVGTSFGKHTFNSAGTTGTIAQGDFIAVWYDNAGGGTLDVRADTSQNAIANQTCTTGSKGSPTYTASNSFTYCYEV